MGKRETYHDRVAELKKLVIEKSDELTQEQRLLILNRIYDLSIVRMLDCAEEEKSKFSATAALLLGSSRKEIDALGVAKELHDGGYRLEFDIFGNEETEDVNRKA